MRLGPGTRIGAYEVVSMIGSGGMGEVYRATDLNLKRDVAIKVLPEAVGSDPDRLARFQREAEVLASLNHPNIGAIYGLERTSATTALVLELVEGPTLADRIAGGAIPIGEALPIARQICEALEAAHEHGIIHRDLKPANIKLRPDGVVKALDFGLAKALDGSLAAPAQSATVTAVGTRVGVMLGTAAYMSPEQARAQPVDKRSDIWAFGCVLYEMLTGRQPFEGATTSDTLAHILESNPNLSKLPQETPQAVGRVIQRCLQKDLKKRLHDIADARLEIEDAASGASKPYPSDERPSSRGLLALLVFATVVAAAQTVRLWQLTPGVPPMRLDITTPSSSGTLVENELESVAISPDALKVVFVSVSEGRSQLWIRSIDSGSVHPLPGTDFAVLPFWSPDSRSIGFFASNELKRIDIDGGSVKTLARAPFGHGGTWSRDGTILFAPLFTGPIYSIPASGGEPIPVTRLSFGERAHRLPRFLPDGRRFLYVAVGAGTASGVFVSDLKGATPGRAVDAEMAMVHPSSGQLLFIHQRTLYAQQFDSTRAAVVGNSAPIAEQVVAVSVSDTGVIAYRTRASPEGRQLVWFDRKGNEIGRVGRPEHRREGSPSLSPDGRYVALHSIRDGASDIWLLELSRNVSSRLTTDPAAEHDPKWSPDGQRIIFNSNRRGVYDLYQQSLMKPEDAELLLATPQNKSVTDWSRDSRFILFRSVDPVTSHDLWALPLGGDRTPFPLLRTKFTEPYGQFSPDGKWIAYQSDESGLPEVYVQPFPGPGTKVRISTSGGAQMRWRPDGKELFYLAPDGNLMAVAIRQGPKADAIQPGTPEKLFQANVGLTVPLQAGYLEAWTISRDGQRFLMNTVTERTSPPPITIILNWRQLSSNPQ